MLDLIDKLRFSLFLLMLLGSLSIVAYDVHAWRVINHGMCKKFDVKKGVPINVTNDFTYADEGAWVFFLLELTELPKGTTVSVDGHWYAPDGSWYTTFRWDLEGGREHGGWAIFPIKGSPPAVKLGAWHVDFYANTPTRNPFNNTFLFTERFTIWGPNAYQVAMSVSGLPLDISAQIYVDGTPRTEIRVGEDRTITLDGKHTISVNSIVSQVKGTRYYCSQYAHNVSSGAKLSFSYRLQYYLTVINGEGGPAKSRIEGEGWYDRGTPAKLKVSPTESREPGKTILFSGWKEDSTTVSNNPEFEIVMNSPRTITATWSSRVEVSPIAGIEAYSAVIIVVIVLAIIAIAGIILVIRKKH